MGLEFLEELKTEIRPDNSEAIQIFQDLKAKLGLDLKLYGSVAKDTNLRNDYDLDVFYETEDDKYQGFQRLKERLDNIGMEYIVKYSEHPYLRVNYNKYNIDLVPISKKYTSAVDRTPLHYNYIISRIDQRSRDEVRLLKLFLKTLGLYGADNRVNGFSGYLSELLILYGGSFLDLLKKASRWELPVIIDIEGVKSREFEEKLVVVDPTDGARNVAAAVSLDNLSRFILYSRAFLNDPSEDYFRIGKVERYGEFGILFEHDYELEDKAYGILRRIGRAWSDYLARNKIFIEYLHVLIKNNLGYMGGIPLMSNTQYIELQPGPKVDVNEHVKGFIRGDSIFIARRYVNNIEDLTRTFLKRYPTKRFRLLRMDYDIAEFREMLMSEYWREMMLKI